MTEALHHADGVPAPAEDGEWRRLTPRMLLVHPVREIGRFFPALLGIFFVGNSGGGQGHWWALGAGAVVIVLALLRWFTTRFRITPAQIEVRSGLFRRKARAAAVDRVRTVDVTSNVLYRVLGLAKVEIGTGGAGRDNRLILDSLPKDAAMRLRAELLHRPVTGGVPGAARASGVPGAITTTSPDATTTAEPRPTAPPVETLLVQLNPKWIRYAPLTLSGVVSGLIIVGFAWRIINEIGGNLDKFAAVEQTTKAVARMSTLTAVVVIAIVLLLAVTLLSVVGYILGFWKFRLTRHVGGTLHATRGLLTTRATSIEERRLRGVELIEPLLLRMAHAGRLNAIATGLGAKGREGSGASGRTLVPPAPAAVARAVGGEVLRDRTALTIPLAMHGPAARRRRYSRALVASGILIAIAVLSWNPGLPLIPDQSGVVPLVSLVLIPIGLLLARDRYRNLGHGLSERFLVRRTGSLSRRTTALQRDGIISWNLHQSYFQRRAGVVTLTATTAAGAQRYPILDLPYPTAVGFAEDAVPGLLRQFLG